MNEAGQEQLNDFSYNFNPELIPESEEELKIYGLKHIAESLPDPKVLDSINPEGRNFKLTFEGDLKKLYDEVATYGGNYSADGEDYGEISHDGFTRKADALAIFKGSVASRIYLADAEKLAGRVKTSGQYGKIIDDVFNETNLGSIHRADYAGILSPPEAASYGEALLKSASGFLVSADRLVDEGTAIEDEILDSIQKAFSKSMVKEAYKTEAMILTEAVRRHSSTKDKSKDPVSAGRWEQVAQNLKENLDYGNEALTAELANSKLTAGLYDKFMILESRLTDPGYEYPSRKRLTSDGLALFYNIMDSSDSELSQSYVAILKRISDEDEMPLTDRKMIALANLIISKDGSPNKNNGGKLEQDESNLPAAVRIAASTFIKSKSTSTYEATRLKAYECAVTMIEKAVTQEDPNS